MRNVKFVSPYLDEIDCIDHGLNFKRGEVKSLPDDVAEDLLRNDTSFAEVPAQASAGSFPQKSSTPPSNSSSLSASAGNE